MDTTAECMCTCMHVCVHVPVQHCGKVSKPHEVDKRLHPHLCLPCFSLFSFGPLWWVVIDLWFYIVWWTFLYWHILPPGSRHPFHVPFLVIVHLLCHQLSSVMFLFHLVSWVFMEALCVHIKFTLKHIDYIVIDGNWDPKREDGEPKVEWPRYLDHSVIPTSAGFNLLNWHGCHHAPWSSLPSNRLALNPQIHLPLVLSVQIKGGCYHIQLNRVIEHLQSSRELSTVSWRKWLRHFSQAFVDRKSLGKVPTVPAHRPMLPALQAVLWTTTIFSSWFEMDWAHSHWTSSSHSVPGPWAGPDTLLCVLH